MEYQIVYPNDRQTASLCAANWQFGCLPEFDGCYIFEMGRWFESPIRGSRGTARVRETEREFTLKTKLREESAMFGDLANHEWFRFVN